MNIRWLGILALAVAVHAQEKQDDEIKLTFNFKDARVEDVLDYVAKVSGWKLVYDKSKIPDKATITAISDGPVSADQALVILDTALRQHGLATINPYAPRLPRKGEMVKIVKSEDAAAMTMEVHYGNDPEKIAPTDKLLTQIIALKGANVVDVQKEMKDTIDKALGSEGKWSVNTYSNSLILTGRSENIRRVALILKVIDIQAADKLITKVFPLKNADATETTKVLTEVFKKETQASDRNANPFGRMFEMFGGGRRQGEQGPSAKSLAGELVRIVADTRTNSVVCVATEQNMATIEVLVKQLDEKSVEIMKLKGYPLQYADATEAAKVVTDIFSEQGSSSSQQQRRQGNPFRPFFMGPQQQQGEDQSAASREVRAVADTRTNTVIVAASEKNLALIDDLMRTMDRQVSDMLVVKIYELKNGDAKEMASVLQSLFRPQVNATQSSGRTTGQNQQGNNRLMQMMGFGGQSTRSGGLPPSQEVEITSDTRTNSVVVKASPEYIKVMDVVVDQLDKNPTESVSTYTVRLRNADASSVAQVLQNLLKSTGSSSSTNRTNSQNTPFGGMNLNQNQGTNSSRQGGNSSTRSGNNQSSTRRGGNLGPLENQDEPTAPLQDDEDRQRGIQGQVDVQADQNTNTLVIRTSPRNYKAIEGIIADLDRLRPQVLIKVLIADVTLTDNMQFGVEASFQDKFSYGGHNNSHSMGTDFGLASNGFTYSLTGDDISAKLNAMATNGTLKILATPRILVLDNQSANINIGKEVPVVSNTQVNQLGNTVNTVRYENVGILLQVTPHINPDGLVTMVVHPEVSDIASQAESVKITEGVNSPTFIVNSADTTVAVRNGQTVVIGGLIRDQLDESTDGIPFLKDIPILGFLFSTTTKKKSKRELMIFLTPYVAYTTTELEELTELEKSKLKLMDQKDIEAEIDTWLERVRH